MKKNTLDYWESRTRSSADVATWIINNKRNICFTCGKSGKAAKLHLHHLWPLRERIRATFKMYQNPEIAFERVVYDHFTDSVACFTLCEKCHYKIHTDKNFTIFPVTTNDNGQSSSVSRPNWTCLYRNHDYVFDLTGRSTIPHHLGLVTYQILLGINWHIINGRMMSGRIIRIDNRELARLLCKIDNKQTSITGFMDGLKKALISLCDVKALTAWHPYDNITEVHLTKNHLSELQKNPWFIRMSDVQGRRCAMPMALRLYLSCFSSKSKSIKLSTLAKRLNYKSYEYNKKHLSHSLDKAIKQIPWANYIPIEETDTLSFRMDRPTVPIHSLRKILSECIHSA